MIVDVDTYGVFSLREEFLEAYRNRPPRWGFGDLSRVIYERTYRREGERWLDTCRRVIEGMVTVQRVHCLQRGLPWEEAGARAFARDAFERLWAFKWTPPGRGLWIMGTRFVYERGGAALNNCGFVSTRDLAGDYARPFVWMLSMSMLGVGVGFDTLGDGSVTIREPAVSDEPHTIADSREGWAEALQRLLRAYAGSGSRPRAWDTSRIRPQGAKLKSFGGRSSGPGPLRRMLEDLRELYDAYIGRKADSRLIVDTMNIIGRCVVAGGIRRSAQIAFGQPDDETFLDLKQDREKLAAYRWVSNNSIVAAQGMDYTDAARRTADNGEPGYLWLDNARSYGRMADEPNERDAPAAGSNPCVEQTLWDKELCCLVETYPAHHDTFDDYAKTLRVAYQYAKTVTLVETEDAATNAVMLRNRRIGCSMSGVVQAIDRLGYRRFMRWCDKAYAVVGHLDKACSDWLCVPRSIKTTSVKPSGTVSLLAGATPGVHWDHAPYYLRRIRVTRGHPLADMCRRAGYPVEDDVYADNTVVIGFPVHVRRMARSKRDVPLREKVDLAAQMQRFWSDNQVSCTAEFDPQREADELPRILAAYEDRLKGIVFLPSRGHRYEQPPYEAISRERYEQLISAIRPLAGRLEHEHEYEARFCEGGACDYDPGGRPD
ncbi:MAG: fused protease/ribonucleoside-triphosphate reductase [Planctomycetota bacterium]